MLAATLACGRDEGQWYCWGYASEPGKTHACYRTTHIVETPTSRWAPKPGER